MTLPGIPGVPPGPRARYLGDVRLPPPRVVLGAAVVLVVFAVFRWEALGRVEAVFLGDSSEYLMLATSLVHGDEVPVSPIRSIFFSLLMAVPLALRELVVPAGTPYDTAVMRVVPLGFHLLACWGAWRLARLAVAGPPAAQGPLSEVGSRVGGRAEARADGRGLAAGFLAAVAVAVLPEFGFWGVDFLTDVPAGTCILWSVVLLAERRAVAAGVAIGLAVLLRYQSGITLLVLVPVPLLLRRWGDFGRLILGGLPTVALLGVLDALYWGMPFQSLYGFATAQASSFVPVEMVEALPEERGSVTKRGAWNWYLLTSPEIFTWPLLVAWLTWLLGRFACPKGGARGGGRGALDLAVWVALGTVAGLSLQRYKESRYLVAIMPLVASVGAASVVALGASLLGRLAFLRGAAGTAVGAVLALGLGGWFCTVAWAEQGEWTYGRFRSTTRALRAIPAEARPCAVGVPDPWLVAADQRVRFYRDRNWYADDFEVIGTKKIIASFGRGPRAGTTGGMLDSLLDGVDYLLLRDANAHPAGSWILIEERMVVVDAFDEPGKPRRQTFLLRRRNEGEGSSFWEPVDEGRIAELEPLVRTRVGLDLLDAKVWTLPSTDEVLRVDTVWRVGPDCVDSYHTILGVGTASQGPLTSDRFWIVPLMEDMRSLFGVPGGVIRLTRFVRVPNRDTSSDIRLAFGIGGMDAERQPVEVGRPVEVGAGVELMRDGRPHVIVPITGVHGEAP